MSEHKRQITASTNRPMPLLPEYQICDAISRQTNDPAGREMGPYLCPPKQRAKPNNVDLAPGP